VICQGAAPPADVQSEFQDWMALRRWAVQIPVDRPENVANERGRQIARFFGEDQKKLNRLRALAW
jgi:hypothetical protein